MKESKNIERLFQEKFKDFEVSPPDESWKIIEARLQKKEKKRRVIPFWFKASGIAATLILGTFLFINKSDNLLNDISNESIIDGVSVSEKETNSSKKETSNTNLLDDNIEINSEPIVSRANERIVSEDKIKFQEQKKYRNLDDNKETSLFKNESNPIVVTPSNTKKFNKRTKSNNRLINEKKTIINKKLNVFEDDSSGLALNTSSNEKEISKQLLNDKRNIVNKENSNSLVLNTLSNKEDGKTLLSNDRKIVIDDIKEKLLKDNSLKTATNQISNAVVAENNNTFSKIALKLDSVSLVSNEIIIDRKEDSTLVAEVTTEENPLEKLLREKLEGENVDEKEKEKRNKWAVSSFASPVYLNSTSEGSSLDSKFESNDKSFNNNLSYGLGFEYELSNKLSVKTGINTLVFDYDTRDVVFYQAMNVSKIENIDANTLGKHVSIENKGVDIANFNSINGKSNLKYEGVVNQKMGYLEVPLELSYKIIDKRFSIDIIGGMSTLFLNENKVSIVSTESKMNIGEANNLNNIHFSSNVGLGFKYTFWKSFQANFQPMFKYQINTFSNDSGNFRPYFIGLYSGLSFSF